MEPRNRSTTRAQTTVLLALSLVPLVGAAGLAVDVGRMYTERRKAQATADLAAAAGAQEESRQGAHAAFGAVVTSYADLNGFTTKRGDTILTYHPPRSGPFVGNPDAYEVIIQRQVPTNLMRVLGTKASTIQGRAVAVVKKGGIGILVLDPKNGADAFKMNKHSSISLSRGTFVVNSTNAAAVHVQDTSRLRTGIKGQVAGGVKTDHGAQIIPPPDTKADPMDDPLAGLGKPDCPPALQAQGPGTADHPMTYEAADGAVLCPGIYYGGIKIDGGKSVTFGTCGLPAGEAVYVMADHGLHVHGSQLTAQGVTIYNTTKNFCVKPDTACGSIHFDQKATVDLTPPSAGEWEGLTIVQDPVCNKKVDISGKALSGLQGELYAPNAELRLKGKGSKKKGATTATIKASFIVRKMSLGNFTGVDDPTESDGEMEDMVADNDDPDISIDASLGGSTRRVVLAE
jgi:hypothetical protein